MKNEKIIEAMEAFIAPIVERCIEKKLGKAPGNAPKDAEQFLTLGQARKEFGCSDHLLRKAINSNELSYYQPDRRVYVKRGDVAAYLLSIKVISKEEPQDYPFLK